MRLYCDICKNRTFALLPYGPHNYCKEHFVYYFEKRFKRTIRKFGLIKAKEHIAVAYSGGKDSGTALFLLNKFFAKSNKITAILIDEGIPNYRDKALNIAKQNCKKFGIPFIEASFEENFGISMAEIAEKISKNKTLGTTCAFCGVLRRNLLNKIALQLKADKIATGHNLDDETQSIVMNFFDNDLKRFARLGAMTQLTNRKFFVPRIKPLYETPENEVEQYAKIQNIKYFKKEKGCPFRWQARRNSYRKMLNEIEAKFPGTKYSILRAFLQIKPLLKKFKDEGKLKKCEICETPTAGKICQACKQLKKLTAN